MSQIQLSELIGVGITTIKKIEKGEVDHIVHGNIKKYIAGCGMPDYFFTESCKEQFSIIMNDFFVKELLNIHEIGLCKEVEAVSTALTTLKETLDSKGF
jgi:transcriptional regulator with XRE-family HTH domain